MTTPDTTASTADPSTTMPVARRRGPLVGLLAVIAIAHTGIRVAAIAIPWLVLTETGSPLLTGLVAAFELGPYVVVKALGGPVVDRIGQRRVSVAADVISALVLGAIPVLWLLESLPLPVLLALVAVGGAVRGPGDNAKDTTLPAAAALAGATLERGTGLASAIERSSGLVAPAVAAGMIALVGPASAVAVTAVCFAISAFLVATVLRGVGIAETGEDESEPYLSRLASGWRFLRRDRLLLTLALMILVTNLIDVAKTTVLIPVWGLEPGRGVAAIGLLFSMNALGQVISSLVASAVGHRIPRRLVYFLAFLIAGPPPYVALGLGAGVELMAVIYLIAGLASGFLNPILGAMFYERIPRHLLARVGGLTDALAWSGMPFGGLVAAGLLAGVGFAPAMFVLAGVYLGAVLAPLRAAGSFAPPTRTADGALLPAAERAML